ncbi:MAG TPA: DUF433 domain-containing protein [Spirochaetota bacterium]|nr:DUF433 domain-containing protein [Spirochaetota bacterium]
MNNYLDRIETNPNIMLGKPIIKGTRITVELIIKKLSEGMSYDDIKKAYPILKDEDIFAFLSY